MADLADIQCGLWTGFVDLKLHCMVDLFLPILPAHLRSEWTPCSLDRFVAYKLADVVLL